MARALPFVCANPDLVVDVGDERYLCAGSLAAEYERLGGEVFWAGKPHPAAYRTALARAAELRGTEPGRHAFSPSAMPCAPISPPHRAWASTRCSLHRASTRTRCWQAGEINPAKLAALFAPPGRPPPSPP